MTDTANLALPCIEGSQAQKHVTHNEALRLLDTLVQLAVLDRDLTAPPGSPAEGQRWIVKTGASGAWAGHVNAIAAWQDGVWQFSTPRTGWLAYVVDEAVLLAWNGSAWVDAIDALAPTALNDLTLLGVGTVADATNPLSAKLNNTLFAARTVAEGGNGNLRCNMSKESAAKTLSILLQDNYSGRAEIGLTGDDDFHLKVSPDGSTWYEAIVIDRNSGRVAFPISGGPRETLGADRTYYVRTDGSDSNTGLVNSAGGAFLTPQKAMDVIASAIDFAGRTVTVQLGDGTYTGGVYLKPWTGGGALVFQGNHTTPANVFISRTGANCFENALGALPGAVTIRDMKLGTTSGGYCVTGNAPCTIKIDGVNFAAASIHVFAFPGAVIDISKNYTISGGASYHWLTAGGLITNGSAAPTVTLSGTPNFTSGFARATGCGFLLCAGHIFSGSATGPRYSIDLNGVVQTGGGGANFLPGSSAGSTATGGQYV